MPQIITEANLRKLVDLLVSESTLVVGPKRAGTMVLYEPLGGGTELALGTLPRRSSKELFFPICEKILSFQKEDGVTRVHDVDRSTLPETVLLGALPCDASAPEILDAVFSWDYHDDFYLQRRKKTTIIGIACTGGDDACFCTAVGHGPDEQSGSDLFLTPLKDGTYACSVLTQKGKNLVDSHLILFTDEAPREPVPFRGEQSGKLDLAKVKAWLDGHFDDPLWQGIADLCLGCGACAFICPACHCFDINDEGTPEKGIRRKHWDACGFGKFTNHASGHNPRDVQNKRYRNRIMHKFKYYDDKFGKTLCTGCGRCIRACPVGIDIAAVLSTINSKG